MARIRAVGFEDRLTLVEHLDELRTRLIVSLLAFVAVAVACFVFNDTILDLANQPLPDRGGDEVELITFGVAEPFTTTLTVVAYAALILTMPIWLWQIYAYVIPAFSPNERRAVRPLLMLVPVLFLGGIVFSHQLLMPAATEFLLNFNDDNFNIQLRARDYYGFMGLTLAGMGLLFQMPVAILALVRAGVFTPRQLARNRRYAFLGIAVIAMLLPGQDPVTMIIAMAPLMALYELSILLARAFGRSRWDAAAAETGLDPETAAR